MRKSVIVKGIVYPQAVSKTNAEHLRGVCRKEIKKLEQKRHSLNFADRKKNEDESKVFVERLKLYNEFKGL